MKPKRKQKYSPRVSFVQRALVTKSNTKAFPKGFICANSLIKA